MIIAFFESKEVSELAKNWAEALGFVGAAVFFLYKFLSGYLVTNLSISVSYERRRLNEQIDSLVITVRLSKGDRGALLLHDAQARVTFDGTSHIQEFHDLGRLQRRRKEVKVYPRLLGWMFRFIDWVRRHPDRRVVDWNRPSGGAPILKMTPGEKTELSVSFSVPRDKLCNIGVVVLGRRPTSAKFGQWRASCISLPNAT